LIIFLTELKTQDQYGSRLKMSELKVS